VTPRSGGARAEDPASLAGRIAVAVVICREGRLPAGAEEAVAEAGGTAVVAGTGAEAAAAGLAGAADAWWWETAAGPAGLATGLAAELAGSRCLVLPASPDGRDLAPRLAANLRRPLLAGAVRVCAGPPDSLTGDTPNNGVIRAELLRVDGQVVVPVEVAGPVVATLLPGARAPAPIPPETKPTRYRLTPATTAGVPEAETLSLVEPDPATMDLADATRVLGGGAGLVPRQATAAQARAVFALLTDVAAALGASAGATRVATDAGWAGHERQIGTTGVAINPDLYVAFGVSGASQHTGGLGTPRHVVSINTDPSCPMTALAQLGIVTDAAPLLIELAERLGLEIPSTLNPSTIKESHG
jgi:electron transfer flavoprotein alpha subunit